MKAGQDDPEETLRGYRAAHGGAVLADLSDRGRLFVSGKDALDLLHRLTTQDIRRLRPGQGTAAAFVTAKGRLIDWVTLHRVGDRLFCLTGPGRSVEVAAYIEKYTFREEVRVEDATAGHGTLGLFGARAREHAARLFGDAASSAALHDPVEARLAGRAGILARTFPLAGEGYHLSAPVDDLPALRAAILAASPIVPVGARVLETLRIEAGLPSAGREITGDYNPWEARLDDAISLNKGCYVGQEVIARLNTYRKVSKLLVRLELRGAVPGPGATLEREETGPIGVLTSAAAVPGEDRVVALGYVRDEDAVRSGAVAVITGDGRTPATLLGPAR